jgi:hypothetical protein
LQLAFSLQAVTVLIATTIGIWQCQRCILAIQTLQFPNESGTDRKIKNAINTLKTYILIGFLFGIPAFVVFVLVRFSGFA